MPSKGDVGHGATSDDGEQKSSLNRVVSGGGIGGGAPSNRQSA
jgi:hypothetical protein